MDNYAIVSTVLFLTDSMTVFQLLIQQLLQYTTFACT